MTQASITMNKGQWNRIRAELRKAPEKMADVVSDTVFRTTNHVRVDMDRETRSEITVQKKTLFKKGSKARFIEQANWGRDYNRAGRVTGKGLRIPVDLFKAKPAQVWVKSEKRSGRRKKGITYQISKGAGRRTRQRRLFLLKFASGHESVMYRTHKSRYPIYEAYGPSVYEVLDRIGAAARMEESGMEYMEKRIMQQLAMKLGWN